MKVDELSLSLAFFKPVLLGQSFAMNFHWLSPIKRASMPKIFIFLPPD